MNDATKKISLPVLPVRNTVLFPFVVTPFSVMRPRSVAAIEAALANEDKNFIVATQKDPGVQDPGLEDLYPVATRAVLKRMTRGAQGLEMIVQGVERVRLETIEPEGPYLRAEAGILPFPDDKSDEIEALTRSVLDLAVQIMQLINPENQVSVEQLAAQTSQPIHLVYLFGSMLALDTTRQMTLLEATSCREALKLLNEYMTHELKVMELRQKIASEAQTEMSKDQREYVLRQQLRAIQEELGEKDPGKAELETLRKRFEEADLPEEARQEARREVTRLESMSPAAPDYQITRTRLELILELPWKASTTDRLDLKEARVILDEDHYDLAEVKERILEHLAVLKLNPSANAPILCFVGPPGVGKTSLGRSIARALGRKFDRMSLGGLHDEAELRGHRRTYIGAMPGRIISAIRRVGSSNPLLMLDEVDKLGRDFRGDPAAALLEILDPAQNFSFRDNYLDLPFDLSKVFFITTANGLDTVPSPLLDRMEVLRLSGYSAEEKMHIARRYLIPRQLEQSGLKETQVAIPDETVRYVISRYTREAGVRQIERALGGILRKIALKVAEGETQPITVMPDHVGGLLGPERFLPEERRAEMPPGVATGLAWTETGGEILYVEASLLPGGKGFRLTGHLGDVMRESAKAAQTWIWSNAARFGIDSSLFRSAGVHIHVPAGAVPKDGPSAGVAMAAALASLYMRRPIRTDTAMTGEVTLTGLVLPIGGLKEKVLAAREAGIRRIVLPKDNEKDLAELPEEVRRELKFIPVETIDGVLAEVIQAAPVTAVPARPDRPGAGPRAPRAARRASGRST